MFKHWVQVLLFTLGLFVSLLVQAESERGSVSTSSADKKVALVIGNARYASSPLKNPVNDARDMAFALRRLGFKVIERTDITQKEMNRAITQFGSKLGSESVAVFFYAGHGIQVKGKNYLVPIDAQIESEASVRSETVDVDTVLDQLSATPMNLVILDACRNNPFERRFRNVGGGLAQMEAPKGTLIAYSTAPGKVASDGEGRNGLYTQELLKVIQTPGLEVEKVFKQVRANVARITNDNQIPWESSSLTGDFYFRNRLPAAATVAATASASSASGTAPDPALIELAYWDGVKSSSDIEAFRSYLDHYPEGQFAAIARIRIRELGEARGHEEIQRSGGKPAEADLIEGRWQAEIPGNEYQMIVSWSPSSNQYEGILAVQGRGSASVGFSLGEVVWKARATSDPKLLVMRQMIRYNAFDARWLDGNVNLSRSSAEYLVTSLVRFKRIELSQ
jgi:hypothetical protein